MKILKFRDFEGSAELDMQRGVCTGRILFIDDVVTYESKTVQGLQKQFENAVLDYIETCLLIEKEPQKSCRGQFNVRVAPELHRAAARRAVADDTSLNDVVCMALGAYLQLGPTEPKRGAETFEARVVHLTKEVAVGQARLQATQFGSAATTVRGSRDSSSKSTSFISDTWQATSSAAAVISQVAEPPYAH